MESGHSRLARLCSLDTKKCRERAAHCFAAHSDQMVGVAAGARGGEVEGEASCEVGCDERAKWWSRAHIVRDAVGDVKVRLGSRSAGPGSDHVALGSGQSFRPSASSSGVDAGDAIQLPRMILRVLCGHFEHQRRVQFEGGAAESLQTITAILLWSKWSCVLLRTVLHDAQIEVMKVYPPLQMKVFVYDFTISLVGRNKDLPKVAERIFKNVQEVVEAKGSTVSITTQGRKRRAASLCRVSMWKAISRSTTRRKECAQQKVQKRWEWI